VVISNLVFNFKELFVSGVSTGFGIPCMIFFTISCLAITLAWTYYLLKSKRVKNTLVKK
jgi:hypothetical protein